MANTLGPLAWNVPITGPDGLPSPEFILKWNAQMATNAGIPGAIDTAVKVSALLDLLGLTKGSVLVRDTSEWVILPPGVAGRPLTSAGPGNLPAYSTIGSILDTISNVQGTVLYRDAAGWAALAPGTNGQFLQTQGAAANPQWAAAGGGGRIFAQCGTGAAGSGSGSAFCFKGVTLVPKVPMTVHSVSGCILSPTAGMQFKGLVAELNNTGVTPTISTLLSLTTAVTGFNRTQWIQTFPTAPVTLAASTPYVIAIGRTDSTGTYALPLDMGAFNPSGPFLPFYAARIANVAPAVSTAVDTNAGSFQFYWAIGFEYTL